MFEQCRLMRPVGQPFVDLALFAFDLAGGHRAESQLPVTQMNTHWSPSVYYVTDNSPCGGLWMMVCRMVPMA